MKNLLLVLALLISTIALSQTETPPCDLECGSERSYTPYIATGISIPNTSNLGADAYASAEVGLMVDNFTVAGVFGVNNLNSFGDGIDAYWYEGKVAYSFPMGIVDGYGVMGIGSYIGTPGSVFIEYGLGIMKSFGDLGTFVQVSKWDGITYITPGLSYSF